VDVIRLRIPGRFVRDRIRVGWRELRFGLDHGLLDPEAAVELAIDQVAELAAPSAVLLELAAAGVGDPTAALVATLADAEPELPEAELREAWLDVVLAWLYDHRAELEDPLQMVEAVYADFGYPAQIASFVRYMPMQGPDLGSPAANEQRLFERWKRYLDRRP
jgi:hypothetical protein